MDNQMLFNVLVGIAGTLGGWILNATWIELRALRKGAGELKDKVSAVEVLVAGKYVTRDELQAAVGAIGTKLDRISDQLNGKADRAH